jgi:hypothetical protein
MQKIEITLTEEDFNALRQFSTEMRAVEICKHYFRQENEAVEFAENPINGVDLEIRFPRQQPLQIEIKGTKARGIAPNQLRVSSEHSFQLLSQGMPLYRVSNVNERNVTIYVLRSPNDFVMTPEPRWRIVLNRE